MTRRRLLKRMLLGTAGLVAGGGALVAASAARAGNRYYSGTVSDHFNGTEFFNPDGETPRGFLDLMRWQFGGGKAAWPEDWASPHAPAKPAARIVGAGFVTTAIGHAAFLHQTAGLNILVDPVFSERMSPVTFAGPKRVNAPGIAYGDLPGIDIVIVTHNHYDHMDMVTLARLQGDHDPLFVTPLGNDAIIRGGVPAARIRAVDWFDSHPVGALTIHAVPCHHWSARGMGDRRHALWAAFVLAGPAGLVHHVGDTGFDGGKPYRIVRERFGTVDHAILPIGAYEPRWFMSAQHQNPEEAVEGFRILGAKSAVGHHWGTVQLTNEAVEAPRDALHAALDAAGLSREAFKAVLPGEVTAFGALPQSA